MSDDLAKGLEALIDAFDAEEFPESVALLRRVSARLEWIKVSDRLPEPGEKVLCYDAKYGPGTPSVPPEYVVCTYGQGGWWWTDTETGTQPMDVTHWMPLPPPPEGE